MGRQSIKCERLLEQFAHYYNTQRPHQSLNGQTPVEVLN
jgi:putative transposase